jgi:hypothetical protein
MLVVQNSGNGTSVGTSATNYMVPNGGSGSQHDAGALCARHADDDDALEYGRLSGEQYHHGFFNGWAVEEQRNYPKPYGLYPVLHFRALGFTTTPTQTT